MRDVIVVGAGAVGLAVGWRAAQRGLSVLVLDRGEPGRGASYAAAGMLAAAGEAEYGEDPLLALGLASAAAYPAFAAELADLTGVDVGYRPSGTLEVALSGDDVAVLRRRLDYLRRLELRVEWLAGSELREREPALSPRVRGAIHSPDDHQVNPRELTRALALAARSAGVELRGEAPVAKLVRSGERVAGVQLLDGERLEAAQIVIAAGAWTPLLDALPPAVAGALRPVKGQILRLRGAPLVRAVVRLPRVYLIPRDDGRVVVGASSEERGFDETVTAGAVLDLLRYAYEGVPGIAELELYDVRASLRPGSRDNLPLLGRTGPEGLVVACGHYRNGILLAPATADLLAALLAGEQPGGLAPFSPDRFAARPDRTHADHAQR